MRAVPRGKRTRDHVALHIAACRDRGEQRLVDRRDGRLETVFDHAVKLESLSGRDAQRAVRVLVTHGLCSFAPWPPEKAPRERSGLPCPLLRVRPPASM